MTASADLIQPVPPIRGHVRPWLTLVRSPGQIDPYVQGVLPLTYTLPSGLESVPRSAAATIHDWTSSTDVPAPDDWASRFLQAVIEVVSSERPLSQLARWTAPAVYAQIGKVQTHVSSRQRELRRRPARQLIASVRVCQISPHTAEVAARVVGGRRSRALAARLDYQRDRWTCTALDFG
jgi:hypothetical protein